MKVVSFGWNCNGAIYRSNILGLTKESGYKTLPFDIVATPYEGLCQCLEDDFLFFFDNLRVAEDGVIMNYYGMWFNHESPVLQTKYPKDYFISNNYENFKNRYKKRIENFYEYLKGPEKVVFICMNPNVDFKRLNAILNNKFKELNYTLFCCTHPGISRYSFYDHFRASVQQVTLKEDEHIYLYDKPNFPSKIDFLERFKSSINELSL